MRTGVWLVRHGQTQFNRERRYLGVGDSPLTEYGRLQTAALAARLRSLPFHVALVSPAERARLTAMAILEGRSHVIVQIDPAWAEINQGRWEGLTYREVLARYPEEARARWNDGLHGRPQGGESLAEAYARVAAAWQRLLREQQGKRVLVVTHATPIQLVLCLCCGQAPVEHWRWRIDLGSITAIDVYSSGPIVRMVNTVPRIRSADAGEGDADDG